jgi:4-hydroxybenzoate polyprenyltransferase
MPLFARTGNLKLALARAVPLLFIAMCTFIINDLDDVERDRINHPARPLPRGEVKPEFVVGLYFVCLALALFTTRFCVPASVAFWYYTVLLMSISYGYVVEYLSIIKPWYVAAASSIPIVILLRYYPQESALYRVGVALFVFMLGRELCKDVVDRPGDPTSPLHRVPADRVARLAFASEVVGLLLLVPGATHALPAIDLLIMTALLALAYLCWFKWHRTARAVGIMKVVIFLGLYFLT